MEDRELLESFVNATLPAAEFPHRVHVRVARLYLLRDSLPLALERFANDLKHFATAHGAHDKFHATITFAFLALINERLERTGRDVDFDTFAHANPDLFESGCLLRYYAPETLASPLAKKTFVLPMRSAL